MRLISCQIENFGKLSHFSYEFAEGISSIVEENGFGKSTFCAFLLTMFYGFGGERKQGLASSRRFYEPWQGGVYGGTVCFETKGRQYRLVRTFGKKESDDTFELYDLSTNLPSGDLTASAGEEIFRIDRNSFLKTVFIGQDDLMTEATDHVNALIGNLSDSEADMTSFEKTDDRLKAYTDRYTPRRKTGLLYKQNEEIRRLQVEEGKGPALEKTMQGITDQLDDTEGQLRELKEEEKQARTAYEKASEAAVNRQLLSQRQSLRQQVLVRQTAAETLRQTFPGAVPEQFEFLAAINAAGSLKQAEQKISENRFSDVEAALFERESAAFSSGIPSEEEMAEAAAAAGRLEDVRSDLQKHALTETEKRRYDTLKSAYDAGKSDPSARAHRKVVIGAVLAGLSLVLLALSIFVIPEGAFRTAGFIAAGLFLAAGLVLLLTANVKKHDAEKEEWTLLKEKKASIDEEALEREAKMLSDSLNAFLQRYGAEDRNGRFTDDLLSLSRRADAYGKLQERKTACDKAMRDAGYEKSILDAFYGKLGIAPMGDVTGQLSGLLTTRNTYVSAKQNENEAREQLSSFESLHDMDGIVKELASSGVPDIEDAKAAVSSVTERQEEKRKELHQLTRQLEERREAYERWAEDHEKLAGLEAAYAEGLQKYRLIEKTRALLTQAKDTLTNRYSAPLLSAFNDYYEQLTGHADARYRLNAKTELSFEAEGRQHEIASFSKGYQDLLSLCLRFSFIDAMYPDEKPFVILDDPFTNLDTEKTAHALAFLERAAEKYQLVYLTCHESRQIPEG